MWDDGAHLHSDQNLLSVVITRTRDKYNTTYVLHAALTTPSIGSMNETSLSIKSFIVLTSTFIIYYQYLARILAVSTPTSKYIYKY